MKYEINMKYDGKVAVSIEFVTPEIAAHYLSFNNSNRSVSKHTVNRYASAMKNGKWELNGETIAFYENGELKDGQHRLNAIIQSGEGQWMIVVRGIPKSTVIHDRGKSRSTTDIMTIAGYETAIRNFSSQGAVKFLFVNLAKMPDVSDDMCMSFADMYGETIAKAYTAACNGKSGPNCKKAPIIAALFCAIYGNIDYETCAEFCKVVNTGFYTGNGQTSGVIFKEMVEKTLYSGNTTSRVEMFDYCVMALSDFKNGVPRKNRYTNPKTSRYAQIVQNECFKKWQ